MSYHNHLALHVCRSAVAVSQARCSIATSKQIKIATPPHTHPHTQTYTNNPTKIPAPMTGVYSTMELRLELAFSCRRTFVSGIKAQSDTGESYKYTVTG